MTKLVIASRSIIRLTVAWRNWSNCALIYYHSADFKRATAGYFDYACSWSNPRASIVYNSNWNLAWRSYIVSTTTTSTGDCSYHIWCCNCKCLGNNCTVVSECLTTIECYWANNATIASLTGNGVLLTSLKGSSTWNYSTWITTIYDSDAVSTRRGYSWRATACNNSIIISIDCYSLRNCWAIEIPCLRKFRNIYWNTASCICLSSDGIPLAWNELSSTWNCSTSVICYWDSVVTACCITTTTSDCNCCSNCDDYALLDSWLIPNCCSIAGWNGNACNITSEINLTCNFSHLSWYVVSWTWN